MVHGYASGQLWLTSGSRYEGGRKHIPLGNIDSSWRRGLPRARRETTISGVPGSEKNRASQLLFPTAGDVYVRRARRHEQRVMDEGSWCGAFSQDLIFRYLNLGSPELLLPLTYS